MLLRHWESILCTKTSSIGILYHIIGSFLVKSYLSHRRTLIRHDRRNRPTQILVMPQGRELVVHIKLSHGLLLVKERTVLFSRQFWCQKRTCARQCVAKISLFWVVLVFQQDAWAMYGWKGRILLGDNDIVIRIRITSRQARGCNLNCVKACS